MTQRLQQPSDSQTADQPVAQINCALRVAAEDGRRLWTLSYEGPEGATGEIWWDYAGEDRLLPGRPSNNDVAVSALLFFAMRCGLNLHVQGGVSRSLLERAEAFSQIWSLWRPDLYRSVQVTADEELPDRCHDESRRLRAVCAFSGGVDAACTVWRHHRGLAGRSNRTLEAGIVIHGFDIPLTNQAAFEETLSQCAVMADDIGLPLVTVSTNWQSVCGDWGMEFGAAVFSCLKPWEDRVGTLLVGSCEDYSRLVVPWGSHPLPTRLLSAADTQLVYDGGELTRTKKVAMLSQWPVGYDNLRVCWEGPVTGRNCGVCEKCVRTKLNAIASGVSLPRSLSEWPTRKQILRLGPLITPQRALLCEIVQEARDNAISNPLIDATAILSRREGATLRQRARRLAGRVRRKMERLRKRRSA